MVDEVFKCACVAPGGDHVVLFVDLKIKDGVDDLDLGQLVGAVKTCVGALVAGASPSAAPSGGGEMVSSTKVSGDTLRIMVRVALRVDDFLRFNFGIPPETVRRATAAVTSDALDIARFFQVEEKVEGKVEGGDEGGGSDGGDVGEGGGGGESKVEVRAEGGNESGGEGKKTFNDLFQGILTGDLELTTEGLDAGVDFMARFRTACGGPDGLGRGRGPGRGMQCMPLTSS